MAPMCPRIARARRRGEFSMMKQLQEQMSRELRSNLATRRESIVCE